MKLFVVEIEVLEDSWGFFVKGQRHFSSIKAKGRASAIRKFEHRNSGSEYPSYKVINAHEVHWLFQNHNHEG